MDLDSYFRGKRITVIGLGLLGRGVGDIRFLAEQGADLIVTDLKSEEALEESLAQLREFPAIRYTLGEHRLEDFEDRDLIVNGPAVPLDSPYLAHARAQGIPITMSAALFSKIAKEEGATIVGVTGTRGKTTVTHLIYEALKAAGKEALIGGNVRGVSTLAQLPRVTRDTYCVLELDSWQLQGFGEEKLSPDYSVFTTFFNDHLNYYKGDVDQYLLDKAQIFLHQDEGDTVVLGSQVAPLVIEKFGDYMRGNVLIASALPEDWELVMPGEHNRYNAACALSLVRALGIGEEVARAAIESFRGVPGRLELVAIKNGIAFYNDATSTTPEAATAALHALGGDGSARVILIAGGADKELDMETFLSIIPDTTKHVSLLAGTGTDRIKRALPEAEVFSSLEAAFTDAVAHAEAGDVVLLSPAFASFGMFRNEYEREDAFNALVEAYGN